MRRAYGYVIDFLDLYYQNRHWSAFIVVVLIKARTAVESFRQNDTMIVMNRPGFVGG